MNLPSGTIEYTLGTVPVTGYGISWTTEELNTALTGPVVEVVFDDTGNEDCKALLEGLSETEFAQETIQRILSNDREPEAWRVGEALAESYLTHHRSCYFPWPDSRDERKSGSSLPGADLVGFHQNGDDERFAFGEVKTSDEAKYPPGTMYGRTGLKQQLEDLRDKVSIRDDLVKYLCHRAINASWKEQFERACKRYLSDSTDVSLFGMLVRDVEPHHDDLQVRVTNLGEDCPSMMSIELIAVYLPAGSIDSLSKEVVQSRKGDNR